MDDDDLDKLPRLEGFTDDEWPVYKALVKAIYNTDAPPDVCLTPLLDLLVMTAHSLGIKKQSFFSAVEAMWSDVGSELDSVEIAEMMGVFPNKKPKDFNVN